jgi:Ca2+-binding RTX toxin-like protein
MLRAAALMVLAVLLPATPATAATVSLSRPNDLTVRGAAGEANDVSIEPSRTAVVVRDAGATLTPHGRCRALDPHAVHCRIRDELLVAQVALGDGNDRVSFPPSAADASATLAGGTGDDEITGIGTLKGGPGDDRVTGTDQDEDIDGGSGADVIDGGGGEDWLDYGARRAPLVVDLATGTGGEAGENDVLAGIENVSGGQRTDTLIGDDGANVMHGAGGRDTLLGLGGDDILSDAHRIDAGPGDDYLDAPGGRLACGPGDDLIDNQRFVLPADAPPVPEDCERWQLDTDVVAAAHPHVGRNAVLLRLRCDFSCRRGAHRFSVRRHGKVLARGSVAITRRGPVTARLRLTPDGRRALRRRRVVTITLRSTAPARTRWRAAIGGPR